MRRMNSTAVSMEVAMSPRVAPVHSVITTITSPFNVGAQDTVKKNPKVLSSPQDSHPSSTSNPKYEDTRTRDVMSFNKVPTPIVLTSSPVDQRRGSYVFLLDDTRSTLIAKESPNGRPGNLDLIIKHDDRLMEKMEETSRTTNEDNDDYSDGGSEGSLDDVRQHHGIIKSSKSDDHEYLTLYEAHLSRLDEVANPNQGFSAGEVQYVEASAEHGLYPNGTGSTAFHYNDNAMFSQQPSATFMDAAAQPQQAQTFSVATTPAVATAASSVPGTYVPVGGQQHQGIPRHPIAHTTRASPATVQWLLENYETAEGVSLPRQTLYHHYLTHCQTHKLDPVNAASFGKLIRSVFLGLKTRRLGTRGNSKYHYYGIRIKPSSPLNALTDDTQVALRQSPSTQKRIKPASRADGSEGDGYSSLSGGAVDQSQQSHHQHQEYLGDVTQGLPDFEDLDTKGSPLPDGVGEDDLDTFQDMYREHCEAFLDVVVNLQFGVVESLWQSFWRHTSTVKKEDKTEGNQVLSTSPSIKELGDDEDNEKRLPKTKLMILCEFDPVIAYVKSCDHLLYQTLVEILIPDVLRPIPSSLTQAIRNFAKRLEGWVAGSLNHVPKKMGDVKVSSCCAFAQTLRRYTSLNHLAQAARAVLQNPSQINQMLNDLNRVDFANVQEQAAWVCQCDDHLVYRIEQDFKLTLQQQNSLEQWATWLEGVVDQFLKPHEGAERYPKAAKQFLLKWSFYSSMIIRDLTLRSAASFGSFHLIRLLYDEYMFYLVEHKVSKAIGASPISVMGEYVGLGSALAMGLDAVENSLLGDQNGENSSNLGELIAPQVPSSSAESREPEAKKPRQN